MSTYSAWDSLEAFARGPSIPKYGGLLTDQGIDKSPQQHVSENSNLPILISRNDDNVSSPASETE